MILLNIYSFNASRFAILWPSYGMDFFVPPSLYSLLRAGLYNLQTEPSTDTNGRDMELHSYDLVHVM